VRFTSRNFEKIHTTDAGSARAMPPMKPARYVDEADEVIRAHDLDREGDSRQLSAPQ
jgi:hypothetical protein